MTSPEKSETDLPTWVASIAKLLRATRTGLLIRIAEKIEEGAIRITRTRVAAVSIALLGVVIAIKPIISTLYDGIDFVGRQYFGWGACYELSPRMQAFASTKEKRICHPGEAVAFKWRYPYDLDGCDKCDNRAFVLVKAEQSGRSRWAEYYLRKPTTDPQQDWGPAHNWIVVDPQANRGSGSYSQGLLFRRVDQPAMVQDGRVKIIEAFVPLKIGKGCTKNSTEKTCPPSENTLYFRNVLLEPGEPQLPEAIYLKNASPWIEQSSISSVIRDPE